MRAGPLVMASLIVLAAAACNAEAGTPTATASARVTFSSTDHELAVRIADSEDERRGGLMGVERLGTDEGMAFLFEAPTTGTFWMKDTLLPLAIAFVDGENRIVAIEEMIPCESDDCPTWDSGGRPYTMAVEANAGWFRDRGVDVGDRAVLEPDAGA